MKLPFPDYLCVTPCSVKVFGGLSENTGAPITVLDWRGFCVYSEGGSSITAEDDRKIKLNAKAIFKGDIAPNIPTFADGEFTVFPGEPKERKMRIYNGHRPRNPDGTVHHTSLEMI